MAAPDSAICRSGTRAHDAVAPLSPHRSAKHRMPALALLCNRWFGRHIVRVGLRFRVRVVEDRLVRVGRCGSDLFRKEPV